VQEVQEFHDEQEEPQELRKSSRSRKKPNFYLRLHEILVMNTEDLTIFQEVMNRDDSNLWHEVMKS
jgi:hypothetical protein